MRAKPGYWIDEFNVALSLDKQEYNEDLKIEKLKKQMARQNEDVYKF